MCASACLIVKLQQQKGHVRFGFYRLLKRDQQSFLQYRDGSMSELSSQKCGCRGKMMNTGEEHVSVSRFSFEVHGINLYGWTGDGQSVHSEVIRFLNSSQSTVPLPSVSVSLIMSSISSSFKSSPSDLRIQRKSSTSITP